MDFAIVTILIFILWLLAKKTKKLLRRLQPEEKLAPREVILIKVSLTGAENTHLAEPAEVPPPEAAAPELPEFSWEPGVEAEVGAQ
jgi:hypothetical protein